MTAHEALAEGRMRDAIGLQEAAVAEAPEDAAARLFLVELFAFAGQLEEARSQLAIIDSDDPAWPASARSFRRLLRAEMRRSMRVRRPVILPEPIPRHAKARWLAVKALRDDRPDDAVRWVDRADELSPAVSGFLDGREFDELRDADDRLGSVLEAFIEGDFVWFPWEVLRRVKLGPVRYALDRLFRPAEVRLKDGTDFAVHLPLVYPGSHDADDEFALGLETDRICPDDGPIRCIGGKLLLAGNEEVPLADCRMIEVR